MKRANNIILTKFKARLRALRSQRGFTLIEILIAIGISMVAAILFLSGMLLLSNSSFFVQETLLRSDLSWVLKSAIMNHNALQKTANHNPLIQAVISNDFTATGAINTNQFYDLSLYDSSDLQIAGTSLAPVLYTIDGAFCAPGLAYGQGNCVVSAISSFMVQGLPSASNLDRMSSVATLPIPGFTSPSFPAIAPSLRADFIFINFDISFFAKPGTIIRKSAKGSVFINMADSGF